MQNQTIAAISTPYGRGGVAKIRISGSNAIEVAEKLFMPKNGKKLGDMPPRSAIYGDIFDLNDKSSAPLDDAIAIFFRAPHSYTGEDTVELDFHGAFCSPSGFLPPASQPVRALPRRESSHAAPLSRGI